MWSSPTAGHVVGRDHRLGRGRLGRRRHGRERRRAVQELGAVERRRDGEGRSDHLVQRDERDRALRAAQRQVRQVAAGVRAQVPVVAHHEQPPSRDGDVERDVGGCDLDPVRIRVEVAGLVQLLAVHGDPPVRVAADDTVAGHADDALDQVLGAARGGEPDELQQPVQRPRVTGGLAVQPAPGVLEDRHVATLDVGDLLHHHAVAHQQGVLHRLRRDDEHLPDEGPQQRRHHQGADDDDQELTGERAEPAAGPPGSGGRLAAHRLPLVLGLDRTGPRVPGRLNNWLPVRP